MTAKEAIWRQLQKTCIHFNGLMKQVGTGAYGFPNWVPNEECKAGVRYEDVRRAAAADVARGRMESLPCFAMQGYPPKPIDRPDTCPHFQLLTDEEAQEQERRIGERIAERWRKTDAGECPDCGKAMTLKQVGRCVYATPCGHRLYQGTLPKAKKGA